MNCEAVLEQWLFKQTSVAHGVQIEEVDLMTRCGS